VDVEEDDASVVQRGHFVPWPAEVLFDGGESAALANVFTSPMILHGMTTSRRLIKTEKGYLGVASMYAEPGDSVCVLFGGQVPFVLRGGPDSWKLVSECYVHGFMDGEAMKDPDAKVRRFELI
jgi:hypothetical protein